MCKMTEKCGWILVSTGEGNKNMVKANLVQEQCANARVYAHEYHKGTESAIIDRTL